QSFRCSMSGVADLFASGFLFARGTRAALRRWHTERATASRRAVRQLYTQAGRVAGARSCPKSFCPGEGIGLQTIDEAAPASGGFQVLLHRGPGHLGNCAKMPLLERDSAQPAGDDSEENRHRAGPATKGFVTNGNHRGASVRFTSQGDLSEGVL